MFTAKERDKIAAIFGSINLSDYSVISPQRPSFLGGVGDFFNARWNMIVGGYTEVKSWVSDLPTPKEIASGLAGALKLLVDAQSAQTKMDTAMNLRISNSLFGSDTNTDAVISSLESQAIEDYQLLAMEVKWMWKGLKASYPECTNAILDKNDENLNQCMGRVAVNFIPFGAFTKVLKLEKLGLLLRSFAKFEKVDDIARVMKIADESLSVLKLAGKTETEAMQILSETMAKIPKGAGEAEIVEVIKKISDLNDIRFVPGKTGNSFANAVQHWTKHRVDFPELKNEFEYIDYANRFLSSPPNGALVKELSAGRVAVYDPITNTLGFSQNGIPSSLYKPDPLAHGFMTNLEYFNSLK